MYSVNVYRPTTSYDKVFEVKLQAKELRHFKVDQILKIKYPSNASKLTENSLTSTYKKSLQKVIGILKHTSCNVHGVTMSTVKYEDNI